jgi:hypothetical protein
MPIECRPTTYFIGDPDILSKTCNADTEERTQEQEDIPQVIEITEGSQASSLSALDGLDLNYVSRIAGEMTQDLLAVVLRKRKIHQAFVKRNEEEQRVRTRLLRSR